MPSIMLAEVLSSSYNDCHCIFHSPNASS